MTVSVRWRADPHRYNVEWSHARTERRVSARDPPLKRRPVEHYSSGSQRRGDSEFGHHSLTAHSLNLRRIGGRRDVTASPEHPSRSRLPQLIGTAHIAFILAIFTLVTFAPTIFILVIFTLVPSAGGRTSSKDTCRSSCRHGEELSAVHILTRWR